MQQGKSIATISGVPSRADPLLPEPDAKLSSVNIPGIKSVFRASLFVFVAALTTFLAAPGDAQTTAQTPAHGPENASAKARASDSGRFEIFVGYSYARVPATVTEIRPCSTQCPCGTACAAPFTQTASSTNLRGFEASAVYKPNSWLGIAADYGDHYGSTPGINLYPRSRLHLQTFMAGPQISSSGRFSGFAHVLLGMAHESTAFVAARNIPNLANNIGITGIAGEYELPAASRSSLAAAVGGGLDLQLSSRFSARLIQGDYLLTRLNSATQNQILVSTGLIFRF